ncbi:carbamoyl-phosphate synthase large subunit [Paenibacillus sp. DS2015]|uniref:ATP-grasp domain-containing protein n=1 Tax=Paenibacillus sp. DS2015 TaxID=3373917 RepID=UPI003D1E86CB
MKTILVSGASGIVGYGILRSLRENGENYKLIGTSIYEDSIAPAFCDIFELAPPTSDSNYIDWLCNIIIKHNVNMIIPGIEADMFKWAEMYNVISNTKVKVLLNKIELIQLCGDKWTFYEKLMENNSKLAIESRIHGSFEELVHQYGLPFLLKPRRGYASKGIVKVSSEEIFLEHERNLGEKFMAQPIIGNEDEEYTISAFFNSKSDLCCYMGLRRKLSQEGYTEKAQVFNVDGCEESLRALAATFKPVGPTNFQFRRHQGVLKLLEINPRISSSTSIRAAFGYNESLISTKYFLDGEIPIQPIIKSGVAIRYIEECVFFDRDNF